MKYPGDAYVAGLIDGEGCISIAKSCPKRASSYRPTVTVGMTVKALPILESLQREFGGALNFRRAATDRWEEAHSWDIGGPAGAQMLRRILPFLQLKQEQAKLAIAVEEIRIALPSPKGIRRLWTSEARQRCEILWLRVKELNRKGPQPRSSRVPPEAKPFAWLVAGEWRNIDPTLFSEVGLPLSPGTWPKSGMTRNGVAYELPTSVPRIRESASSSSDDGLLPTPTAQLNAPAPWKEGVDWWKQSRATRNLEGVVTGNTPLLPTPVARDYMGVPGDNVQMASLPREISLLPTPMAGEDIHNWRDNHGRNKTLRYTLSELLPTPSAGVFNDGEDLTRWEKRRLENIEKGINGNGQGTPLTIAAQDKTNWGRYSGAIFFWENVLARKAPVPTEPTGRNGNPRLSPRFVEWMMGCQEGWVTDVPGLKRRGQLHALGNGVVPQQAEMALRLLLARIPELRK